MTTSVISDRLAHGRQRAGCQVMQTLIHQHQQLSCMVASFEQKMPSKVF